MAETITVTIPKDPSKGKVTIEVNGVKGISCKDLTAALIKATGDVERQDETCEFYEAKNEVQQQQPLGGGFGG